MAADPTVGLISGSGGYDWPLTEPVARTVRTEYGEVPVTTGRFGGRRVVHSARHGGGHARLSHQVTHRANLAALLACDVDCLVSLTVCGAVDPHLSPGSLVVFDDLYFPDNRLPDGSPCTWHTAPGEKRRGHWIFDRPFAEVLRQALIRAGTVVGHGTYGHVTGPRFNTRAEIAALAAAGVTAISQTCGPEVVLAGEAELPTALVGYITDYANGIGTPEPIEALRDRLPPSTGVFARLLETALPRLSTVEPTGVVYRFEP